MFPIKTLKDQYAEAIGYDLFDEAGEVEHYYLEKTTTRDANDKKLVYYDIVEPVSGIFTTTPVSFAAIQNPVIAVLTANVTMAVPESRLVEVRNKLNDVAQELNGTSFTAHDMYELTGKTHYYSVVYNIQPCSVGEKNIIGAGTGEYFPVYQTITYTAVEMGVPSSDYSLKIDTYDVPILTCVVNQVATNVTLPNEFGVGKAVNQQNTIGIDFTCPYLSNELGQLLMEACNKPTGNNTVCVHCVSTYDDNYHLMIFGNCTETIQPPSNIGFNISMVEVDPLIANFGTSQKKLSYTGTNNSYAGNNYGAFSSLKQTKTGTFYVVPATDLILAINPTTTTGKTRFYIVFWGDETSEFIAAASASSRTHTYTDGATSHQIVVYSWEE